MNISSVRSKNVKKKRGKTFKKSNQLIEGEYDGEIQYQFKISKGVRKKSTKHGGNFGTNDSARNVKNST